MNTRLAPITSVSPGRFAAVRVLNGLLAAAVIAIAMPAISGEAETPATAAVTAQERVVGQFTGKFENGTPVYRFPTIRVSASRSAELARIEREERLTRAAATRARSAARPPA